MLSTFLHDPAVRLTNVFFSFLLVFWVLVISNTDLGGWAALALALPVATLLTVIERWLYNDLTAPARNH